MSSGFLKPLACFSLFSCPPLLGVATDSPSAAVEVAVARSTTASVDPNTWLHTFRTVYVASFEAWQQLLQTDQFPWADMADISDWQDLARTTPVKSDPEISGLFRGPYFYRGPDIVLRRSISVPWALRSSCNWPRKRWSSERASSCKRSNKTDQRTSIVLVGL